MTIQNICRTLMFMSVVCTLYACTSGPDGEDEVMPEDMPFVLSEGFDLKQTPLGEGYQVGFFFSREGTFSLQNSLAVTGKGGTLSSDDVEIPEAPDQYEFFAYSPYDSGWNDVLESLKEFSVKSNQSLVEDYRASDLMFADAVEKKSGKYEAVFAHQMARIVVHVTDRTGSFDLTDASAALHDLKTSMLILLSNSTVQTDGRSVADITCHLLDSRDRRASFAALVPPQNPSDEKLALTLHLGQSNYEFTIPDMTVLKQGLSYICSMSMTDRGLVLEGSSVSDWDDDGGSLIVVPVPDETNIQ